MEGLAELSWSSFDATMPAEESELMAQLLGPHPLSWEQEPDPSLGSISSLFWSGHMTDISHLGYWPPENDASSFSTSTFFAPTPEHQASCAMSESYVVPYTVSDDDHEHMMLNSMQGAMLACLNEEITSSEDAGDSAVNSSERVMAVDPQKPQHKRKFSVDEVDKPTDNNAQKKTKVSPKTQKSAKTPKSKSAGAANVQSSSYSCSEDDSKTRASRGSATDPQSLYARKRRERINERLRILQNLVPNGTKVDISTMLEEAVEYVKFLQLQIKLLSSDDLWMYAPLAYNGMDIGLDLRVSLPPRQ